MPCAGGARTHLVPNMSPCNAGVNRFHGYIAQHPSEVGEKVDSLER